MSDLIDLLQPTQDRLYATLRAAIDAAMADVRQAVKENTQPPMVVLGDLDTAPLGDKGGSAKRITFDVHSVYRGDLARRGLLALMFKVFAALHDQPLDDLDGATFSSPTWLSEATATGQDGVTYAGISQFELIAEPA